MNGLDKTNYQEPIACSDAFVNFDCAGDILGKLDMMSILELLRERPATPQEILEAGWLLFAFAQFEAALILLADLPESPEASLLRRSCYMCLARWSIETGDLARAEWASEQQLRDEENAYESLVTCGEVASLKGDDATALEFFNRGLVALPREYAATSEQAKEVNRLLYLRVAALVKLRKYEEAFDQWRSAVQRSTDNSDLWYLGAFCLIQLGRGKEALPLCQRALQIDPRHIDAGKLKRHIERQ